MRFDSETMARAALDAPISFKKSIELSKRLRGMMSDRAERYLDEVRALRRAVPFTRFTDGAGHRRGKVGPGKYPVKTAASFLTLLKSAVANAENKGLGTPLKIVELVPNQASKPQRAGGREGKRTSLRIVLAETEDSKRSERRPKKKAAKETPAKQEEKPAAEAPKTEKAPVTPKKDDKPVEKAKEQKAPAAKPAATTKPAAKPAPAKPAAKEAQDGD